jgi:heme exporter protein CcmD
MLLDSPWPHRLECARKLLFYHAFTMEKLTDLLAMDGYGAYIWAAYTVATLVLLGMTIAGVRSLKRAKKVLSELQGPDET